MKDHICHIYAWVLMTFMLVLPACDRTEDDLLPDDQVRLKASLAPALSTVYTKGDGEITSVHAEDLEIGLTKVQEDNASFDGAEASAITAVMKADEDNDGLRDIEFGAFQAFPSADGIVNYIAWYPQSATYSNPDDGRTTVTFTVDGSTDILYSDVASGNRRTGFNTITFRHALVKYSVMLYGTEETAGSVADTWGHIQSVMFKGMPNSCVLSLPENSTSLPAISSSGSADLAVSKTADIPIGFSNATEMGYILAPAPSNKVLNLSIATTKQTIDDLNLSVSSSFQSGKHYKIYLRFSPEGVINAEIKVDEWENGDKIDLTDPNGTVFYDLSETHTANSYIVSAPNSYCFNATVRGNGYTGIAGIPGAAADLYLMGGEPVFAEIVWTDLVGGTTEDANNMDNYFTLSPKVVDGRVFFSVKPESESSNHLKKEGNVVIGVKDAAGNMLWTWHIWITDRPAEQGYKNGFAVQDRDLGATAYAPTGDNGSINGFYYQWGRPTPLPLGKTVYKPKYDNSTGAWISNETVSFKTSADAVTVINRVAEPTVYFTQKATATDALLTKSLWGWRNETDEYAKTVYDPCPPGYRVPSIKLWRDLVILDENGDGSHDAQLVENGEGENIAVSFKVDANHLQIYYPMTGYYTDLNTRVDNGIGAYMWAATYDLGTNLNDASDDHPYALDFAKEGNSLKEMEIRVEVSNYAMPVRCISRMSKAHVADLSDYQTANSYIVSKKGYYKFKAVVRGNGIGKLVPPGSTSSIDLTEQLQTVDIKNQLVKVEPLWWQSYASQDAPSADNFTMLNDGKPDQDGFVSFEVEEMKEGNMILAGYDAKGEIIWSWHIWLTDEPVMMKSNSFVVMDRNLGATFAPITTTEPTGTNLTETCGLYYQWGRKDPFAMPDGNIYKYSSGAWAVETVSSAFETQSVAANKTVGNSVANPMTYHLASTPVTTGNGVFAGINMSDFDVTDDDNMDDNQCFSTMVKPEDRRSLWGYSATSGYGVTTTKTMYDPCPPGYMVAHYLVWTNTERSWSNLYYSSLDGGFRTHNINGTGGIFLTEYEDLFDKAWYPFTGYIKGDSFAIGGSGSVGVFHTSTPAGNGSRSLMYNSTKSGQAVDENYRGLPSSFGYPVRCQKE